MSRLYGRREESKYLFVVGDRQPSFKTYIRKADGSEFPFGDDDITEARIRVRKEGVPDYSVDTNDVIYWVSDDSRKVYIEYQWKAGDIVEAGTYGLEVEVILNDATSFTSPTRERVTLIARARV
jgi:hypothetical protein